MMQTTFEQEQLILWSLLHEPGDSVARAVFDARGIAAIQDFKAGVAEKLWPQLVPSEQIENIPDLIERIGLRLPVSHEIEVIERAIRWNARPVFEAEAPKLFARLKDLSPHHPYLLWVAGNIDFLEQDCVAVVGTRNPSDTGLENTRKLVHKIQLPIVSGGAKGIDAEAHKTALQLGLPTAAFMAGGLDRAYPQTNWELFHQIVQAGGAMISEMACTVAPTRFRFLQRNRLIAASATSTFVVEAGFRSGSKNTAGHARTLGRNTYALAGPKDFPPAAGCNQLINSGFADPVYLTGSVPSNLNLHRKRVEDALLNGAKSTIDVARESGLSIKQVQRFMPGKA
jgi:DNA processing protein